MSKVIHCECGSTVAANDDDSLVGRVEEHVRQVHPDLVGRMSRDDILAMAEEE